MVCPDPEVTTIQVMMAMFDSLYDRQQLFADHAVIALRFGQTATIVRDHLFFLILNLQQDSPNPETTGISVKDEGSWKRQDGRRREGILQLIHRLLAVFGP